MVNQPSFHTLTPQNTLFQSTNVIMKTSLPMALSQILVWLQNARDVNACDSIKAKRKGWRKQCDQEE